MKSFHCKSITAALIVCLLFSVHITFGQDYYWVGNTGNWSDVSHWATSSGGSVFHSQPPTQNEDVYFDANSFSLTSQTVIIDALANCNSINWTGVTNTPTFDISNDLYIAGSLTFAAGVTLSGLSTYRFTSSSIGNTITTAGLSPRYFSFEGSGDWTLQDNLNVSTITLDKGTLTTNNNSLICGYFYFSDGTSTRQLNLGSSAVTVNFWDVSVGTNLTIDAGTSSMTITSTLVGGDFAYYDVLLDAVRIGVNGSNTFETLTIASGTIVSFEQDKTQTVNDLQATGDCSNIISFKSSSDGVVANIVQISGTVNLDYVELTDISASGGATFNATNGIDGGNNSGWNITTLTGTTYYWVGDGGNWSNVAHWSLISGGSGGSCLPTRYDNVVFDANSFSSLAQVVKVDDLNANCLSMNWTGVTNTPDLDGSRDLNIYGSLTLVAGMTVSYGGIADLTFKSDNTGNTVTTAGHALNCYVHFDGTGEWALQDDIIYARRFYLDEGSLITDGNDITTYSFYLRTGSTRQLTLGSSVITCTNQWNLFDKTNLTFDAGTSTIVVGSSGTFYGEDQTYYDVQMNSTQGINILGSNTFNELLISNSKKILIDANSTQTLNTLSIPSGTGCTNFVTLNSTSAGYPATISMSGGNNFDGDYLIISDIIATGGDTFNANNSIGIGIVTGWNITEFVGQNFYWIGGTGSWTDTEHWSLTSGGAAGACFPSLNDAVFFDQNSFTATGQWVNMNETAYCKSMDWTESAFAPEISGGSKLNVTGSLKLIEDMIMDYSGAITFLSDNTGNTITTAGQSLGSSFTFNGTGEYTLQDDLETSSQISFRQGTFDTNSFDVTMGGDFLMYSGLSRNLNLGSSTITMGSWNLDNATNLTFDAGTSEIILTTSANLFAGAGFTYYDVTIVGPQPIYLSGSNTFNILSAEPGVGLTFEAGTTQTFNRILTRGTDVLPSSLISSTTGVTVTISQSTPNFCGDYLNIQDIVATGGAPFFSGANSNDLGNNTGWSFTNCVKPVVDAGVDVELCFGDNVAIGGSPTAMGGTGPYAYVWSPPYGLSSTTIANPTAVLSDTTTFIVTVTDNLSAQSTDTITVFVKPLPLAKAEPDTTICAGASVQLNATGGVSYSWSPGSSLNDSSIPNPIATPSATTTYTMTVTDVLGCSSTDYVTVTVDDNITANAGTDMSICFGESTVLNGSGGQIYAWSPKTGLSDTAIANPTANPIVTTIYTLTTTSGTCSDTDIVEVTVNSLPLADAGIDATICSGDTVIIGGTSTGNGGTPPYAYSWTPAGLVTENSIANPSVFPAVTTEYVVTVTDANGCPDKDTLTVFVNPLPTANAGVNNTVCPSEMLTLGGSPTASGGTPPFTYAWVPSNLVDDNTLANPVTSPVVTSDYIVTITDTKGCQDIDTVTVTVDDVMPQAGFTYIESGERMFTFTDTSIDHSAWLWDLGDGSTSVLRHPTHDYTENGTYQVCLTVSDACYEDVICETITINILGVNAQDPSFELYPNPAHDVFVVKFNANVSSGAGILIYSMTGQVFHKQKIVKRSSSKEFKIKIVDWPVGIYVISIENGDSTTIERLVISKN